MHSSILLAQKKLEYNKFQKELELMKKIQKLKISIALFVAVLDNLFQLKLQ